MSEEHFSHITPDIYTDMKNSLLSASSRKNLFNKIVNLPFSNKLLSTTVDLGIIVLLQINPETKTVDRVALSDTELARGAVRLSAKQFHEIKIPVAEPNNLITKAIRTKEFKFTEDWTCLFNPILTPEQARLNQASAGIECSLVYPLSSGHGGALIFSFYQPQASITDGHLAFVASYADMVDSALNKHYASKS
jgi:hypothetical protein